MKKYIFLLFLIMIFLSCEKAGDLKFSDATPGGCAIAKGEIKQ